MTDYEGVDMSDVISDEAVEAAALAIWNVPPIREGRATWEYFNENNPAGPEKLRKQARAALEAAAPYLAPAAVPQPVDREALISILLPYMKCSPVVAYSTAASAADEVLGVLPGEQEQAQR